MFQTVIVQARCSSRRLPGKVLKPVAGRPMIQFLTERLARCRLVARVIVATSDQESDNDLAAWCAEAGLDCVRGPLDDVAGRFLLAARRYGLDSLVRINADSPLLDPAIVDQAVAMFAEGQWDLVTNVLTRSFPKGQSVEVVRTSLLAATHPVMTAEEREHVTQHFYRHADSFTIGNFTREPNLADLQHSVDTPEDFAAFAALVAAMTRPHWEYGLSELLALSRETASPPRS
jgi:spore coat polysaccharide biosynthesis protein SpsF